MADTVPKAAAVIETAAVKAAEVKVLGEAVQEAKEDNWKYRRTMAFGSVIFMLALLGYLTVFSTDTNAVQSMLAQTLPLGIIGIIITYIGGPIADDWLQLRTQLGARNG